MDKVPQARMKNVQSVYATRHDVASSGIPAGSITYKTLNEQVPGVKFVDNPVGAANNIVSSNLSNNSIQMNNRSEANRNLGRSLAAKPNL